MEKGKDAYFLIVGKMLFIATEFERDIKSLMNSLSFKSQTFWSGVNQEVIEQFCSELEKFQSTKSLLKEIEKPKELQEIFKDAIAARNLVAHEMSLEIEILQDDEESLNKFLQISILPNAKKILEAHCVIQHLIFQFNKVENVSTKNWSENRMRWLQDYT
jgi:hypothetical protein